MAYSTEGMGGSTESLTRCQMSMSQILTIVSQVIWITICSVAMAYAGYSLFGHRHQWLPWTKVVWNGKPLSFSGAFGYRETEITVCATCAEVKIRQRQETEPK
jgi:hypothetical protein